MSLVLEGWFNKNQWEETMGKEHIRGAADNAKGAVKDAVSGLTGSRDCKSKANMIKAKGAPHVAAGDLKDTSKDADRPSRKAS